VLQDPKSYESMRNAIGILKLMAEGESDIRDGKVRSQDEVFASIEDSVKKMLSR